MMYKKVTECRKKLRKVLEVSKSFRNFAAEVVKSADSQHMKQATVNSQTVSQSHQVEVLTFHNGTKYATVVTDGDHTRSFEYDCQKDHETLKKGIAYLESIGYQILNDYWV